MQVKCQWCESKDERETMTYELKGKQKKYYHSECYDKYLLDKEFKQQERVELNQLVEVIKQIYNINVIPNQLYPYLQQLRNGDVLFGKIKKQYKQGVSYQIIADTYRYCEKDIYKAKQIKNFNNVFGELRYGVGIVRNNIEDMLKEKHKQQLTEQKEKELHKQTEQFKQIQQRMNKVKNNNKEKDEEEKIDLTTLLD